MREIDLSKAVANYCPGRTCNVDVKVTVPDEGKVCSWEFPLIIYVKMPEVVIKWRLTNSSSAGAEFVDIGGKPGPGIDIKPDASGSKHYKNPKRMPKEFSWDRASAGLSVSAYDFNVQFDGGRQNCEIPDPLIINID